MIMLGPWILTQKLWYAKNLICLSLFSTSKLADYGQQQRRKSMDTEVFLWLQAQGHTVGRQKVADSLQANRKTKEGTDNPD